MRWWPVLLVQGLLVVAYFFFFLGAEGEDAAIAAAFMVIGVLLGRLFLKEKVISGIASLSALG